MLPSQRGFKLASLNINKLITHIDQLRILLAHNELDILSINETKLNETIIVRWLKAQIYTERTKAPNFAWL